LGKYHHSTFCDTEEYTDGDEIAKVADGRGTGCDETERDDEEWQVILWTDLLQKNI
jgi:hypothetical protein